MWDGKIISASSVPGMSLKVTSIIAKCDASGECILIFKLCYYERCSLYVGLEFESLSSEGQPFLCLMLKS